MDIQQACTCLISKFFGYSLKGEYTRTDHAHHFLFKFVLNVKFVWKGTSNVGLCYNIQNYFVNTPQCLKLGRHGTFFFCFVWNSANDVTPFCPFSDLFLFFLPKNTSTFFSFFFPLNTTPLSPLCWISHAITVLNQLLWTLPSRNSSISIHFSQTFVRKRKNKTGKIWKFVLVMQRETRMNWTLNLVCGPPV